MKIFEFTDYRDFLRYKYDILKSKNHAVSLAWIADKLNQSKMAVKFVLDEKRHIAINNIENYSRVFSLDEDEAKYFKYLVQFNKAKTTEHKAKYFEKILKIKSQSDDSHWMDFSEINLFKDWYYTAISEMSVIQGFQLDAEWIQKKLQFPVSKKQIEEVLESLSKHKQLAQNSSLKKVKLKNNFASHVYKNYVHKQLQLAGESIEKLPREDRESFTITIAINEDRMNLLQKKINEFRHELHDLLADEKNCDRVVQINLQAFLVAKDDKKKDDLCII